MPKTKATPAVEDNSAAAKPDTVERVVYAIVLSVMAIVPLLAFLFSFGNVGDLGVHLGIDRRIAYLTGPGVDLTATGMIVAATWLSYRGRTERELLRVHVLSVICALMMFGLNCGPAIYIRHYQLAAFNAVGPFLLMAMGFVGPWLLRQLAEARQAPDATGSTGSAGSPAADVPKAAVAAVTAAEPAKTAPADATAAPAKDPGGSAAPAVPAVRSARQPTTGSTGRPKAGDDKISPWANLALPLWNEYVEKHKEPPTAPVLGSLMRRAHPDLKIPASERSERIIRADVEKLLKPKDDDPSDPEPAVADAWQVTP